MTAEAVQGEVTSVTDELHPDDTAEETAPAETGPTLADLVGRFGAVLAADTEFKRWVQEQRADLYQQMLAARAATGGVSKSFSANYDEGLAVTFTLKGSSEKFTVTNPRAFAEWVETYFPDEVDLVPVVAAAFEKQILEKWLVGNDGEAFVKDVPKAKDAGVVGEQVPGVKHTPANDEPTGFGTSWKGGDEAKAAALATMTEAAFGQLLGIEAGQE